MVNILDPLSHDDVNLKAAFTVAFAAFLRPAEFTWDEWNPLSSPLLSVSRGSVSFTEQGALLVLPRSKTDQFGVGNTIPLAAANDACCPVAALRVLYTKYPKPASSPLFSRASGPFDKTWLSHNITRSLLKAGMDPQHFSGHSFRRGAANSAVAAGIPKDQIKDLGRWKSDAVNLYFTKKSTIDLRLEANRKLHLAPSSR
jgi:hypothetical protein